LASIFVSYRRSDSVAWARLLRDSFARNLPDVQIFRDIDAILPGDDFAKIISDAVASCDVLIALIGPGWVTAANPTTGSRRLHEANDFTRIEVATALARGVRVIPVLVGGATMPNPDDLPGDLKALCDRQNSELSDRAWDDDCRRLADVLLRVLPAGTSTPPVAPTPPPSTSSATPDGASSWMSPTTRRLALGAGGATGLAAVLWGLNLWRQWPGRAPPAPQPEVRPPSPTPAPSPSPPRTPSLLDLDLAGVWRPFTEKTPQALVRVARQGRVALELTLEPLEGSNGGQRRPLGRVEVEPDSLSYSGPNDELRVELRRQDAAGQNWSMEIVGDRPPKVIATGTAAVDPSGRRWRAKVVATKTSARGGDTFEWRANLSSDGTKLVVESIPPEGSKEGALQFVYVRPGR
jgi:hypothetical protein